MPFGGLVLRLRNQQVWRLYHFMQTALNVVLSLNENEIT